MTVIEASSAGVKDMADGSLRITFEFEPRHAAEAFALFGPRGRAVAIAALKDGAAAVTEIPVSGKKEREHVGDLCYRAVMWCKSGEFQNFIRPIYDRVMGGSGSGWGDVGPSDFPRGFEEYAAHAIKVICRVDSRKELDSEPARSTFMKEIVGPWQKYQMARRAGA